MKFLSVKEYFYKLNTIGFIVLLLPTTAFAFLHYRSLSVGAPMADIIGVTTNLTAIAIITTADLTIVHLWWALRMKRLRSLIEIARKMDGYYSLTVTKMLVYCFTGMMMAVGFFLTANDWFSGLFVLLALSLVAQWPSRSSFCSQFQLRSDERAMIMENVDFYQKR
jgi:hypothetical protein